MNRASFIKSSLLGSLGFSIFPKFLLSDYKSELPYDELIGKGNASLFGRNYKLRRKAYLAFLEMVNAARQSSINIQVVSSYRSYKRQNQIWERKFLRNKNRGLSPSENIKKIIEYSTIPGTSRHHWGSDLDIIDAGVPRPNSVLNPKHFEDGGCFRKLKLWLDQNSESFGFYLVYTNKIGRKGFNYEPWHYSYKPLSQEYLKTYCQLDLKKIILKENLMGAEHFSEKFVEDYLKNNILDINPALL